MTIRSQLSVITLSLMLIASPVFAEDAAKPAAPAAPATTAAPAPATKFPAAVIAVVDMQKILRESVASKSVRDQLAGRRNTYQKQVTADEQKLREAEKQLTQDRTKLSQADFDKKRHEFEENVRKVQQNVQDRSRILDTAFNEALVTIRENVGQIVADLAAARGATVVLDKGQVVVVESTLDITKEVLAELDKKLPKIDVKLPPETPTKPAR